MGGVLGVGRLGGGHAQREAMAKAAAVKGQLVGRASWSAEDTLP